MNERVRGLAIAAVMVVAIGGVVLAQKNATPPAPTGAVTTTPSGGITMEEVAAHGTRESCWSVINGGVYDLTSWIPQHPGGEQAILVLCGTDGSARFNGQHGGAQQQAAILAGFKIGDLGTGAAAVQAVQPAVVVPAAAEDDSGRNRRGRDDGEDDSR